MLRGEELLAGFRMDICRDSLRKSTNESNAKMHQPDLVIRDTLPIPCHREIE
jgi:hypothetical protein